MPKFTPSWKKHEQGMYDNDPKVQRESSDKFHQERQHELETDPQARRWEESRKEAAAKEKPEWVKKQRGEQAREITNILSQFKKAGRFMKEVHPVPGFMIVKMMEQQENVINGLIIPGAREGMPNTAVVVRVSEDKTHENGVVEKCPAEVGDEVMLKFGAGLDLTEKGIELKFVGFADVLGVLK